MAIYEFVCTDCGTKFSMSCTYDIALSYNGCPFCKSTRTKRVYNSIPIIFKGKGFYKNDSKKGKNG